ncbi:MAG: heme NO-binding domain-containing protein [Actinomycetota bacterium]|nr:heme NO-binding domain-containing protein [Actinomycetota bacterium]
MHGVVFTSFRDYVSDTFGAETAAAVMNGEPVYLLSESYPDDRLLGLVARTAEQTGNDPDQIVHDFGVFTGEKTFTRLYPAFFAISPSARQFMLTVETRIHELVRATLPKAGPPELEVSELGEDGISIVYTSPRQLCVLLRGLTEGTARHYGEQTQIEETTCMLRGDPACTFQVRFSPAAQLA